MRFLTTVMQQLNQLRSDMKLGIVLMVFNSYINSQIYGHGRTVYGDMHGASGGILSTVNFDINNSERVVAVLGYYDTSGIKGLVFFTSMARALGPYGGCAGETFRVWGCQIRGVFGVYNSETLVSIAFYCTHVVP